MKLSQKVLDEHIFYLKTIKYKNKIQTLRLEHCTDTDGQYIYLVCIKIKKSQTNKGYGQAVMSEILNVADLHNVRIRLYCTNIFGADLNRLYSFYQKLGFVLNKNTNIDEMLYHPEREEYN